MLIRHLLVCGLTLVVSINALALTDTPTQIVAKKPGGPIGGIVVKGGKNPGGQMLVQTTTDANGKFTMAFTEGGEYQLRFDQAGMKTQAAQVALSKTSPGAKVNTSITLDYSVNATNSTNRQAPIHKKIENDLILITIPAGGASVSGVVNLSDIAMASETVERSINESGVSVKSETKKAVKK
jgi:hypothetical protein